MKTTPFSEYGIRPVVGVLIAGLIVVVTAVDKVKGR